MNILEKLPKFYLSEVRETEIPQVIAILSKWKGRAVVKWGAANPGEEKGQCKDEFRSCAGRCQDLLDSLSRREDPSPESQKFYLCREQDQVIQAIMEIDLSLRARIVTIETLVTNPKNIRSEVNSEESGRVAGAGSFLLESAELLALNTGCIRVELMATLSSIGFYAKKGYVEDPKEGSLVKKIDQIRAQFLPREAA